MLDVTKQITKWVLCCNEVWTNWFASNENGDDEFYEVEEALFSTLVLSNIALSERPRLSECYALLTGVYKHDIADERSVCKRQTAGNIFCQSKKIIYSKNTSLPIKSIDFMGTMLDGQPYAELSIGNQEFILEPLININININI
jgi:hypothetical protein